MNKYIPEYMAAVLANDKIKATEIIAKMVAHRCRKIAAFATLDPITHEFTAAALKIVANSVYNVLDEKEKSICDEIVKRTNVTCIVSPLNAKTKKMRDSALGEESY